MHVFRRHSRLNRILLTSTPRRVRSTRRREYRRLKISRSKEHLWVAKRETLRRNSKPKARTRLKDRRREMKKM